MPTTIRRNERSWAISMISDINIMLRNLNLMIIRAGGETTISTGYQSMFPDVLLYGDEGQTQILQGWELKLPDTAITDTTFINDAQRKARSLGLNSCFIWNFNSGVLYVKDDDDVFRIAKQWNQTNHIRTRADVERFKNDWLPVVSDILLEINEYLITGAIHGSELGEIVSDSIVATIIQRNKGITSSELQRASAANALIGAYIDVWWNDIQDEFISDENNKFDAYAKVILLNWTNRLLFAHLIKRNHNTAMRVENLNFDSSIEEANATFELITSSCDFYNIFNGMEYNAILPESTWCDLMDLNVFLTDNGVNQIEQTSLQTILENTVAMSKREVNGQFTTPTTLANLLTRITIRDWNGNVIDPCCGTGSIPHAVIALKKNNTNNIERSVETTWASDKYSFPLQIANISLTGADTINIPSRVFQHNVFSLSEGEEISVVNPTTGEEIKYSLPLFDAIVANLPFVPFEKISETDNRYINSIIQHVSTHTGILLSGRCDYYAYIIFSLWNILNSNGRLGVITSNSWLGTSAGREFFKALSAYYKIEQVHISKSNRWFDNAMVITMITILSKRDAISFPDANEETIFCSWNKSLSGLSEDRALQDTLVNSSLLNREIDSNVVSLKPYTSSQIKAIEEMNVSLSALFHDVSWLLNIKDALVPISEVFTVVRGERRGWDAMFYPEGGHGIESRYIKKVLKNARSVNSLIATADSDAFCCFKSINELRSENHHGALAWIARFQNGVNGTGRPLPEVLRRANMFWYEMKDTNTANLVTTMNPDRRLFFAKFEQPSFINQRLIGLKTKNQYRDVDLNHALLNSVLGMFYIEAVGFGRGLGALDINSNTIRNAYMLKPNLISATQREHILNKFAPLLERPIFSTEVEFEQRDRIEFEHTVLSAYGIDEYFDAIKGSLLSMQKMRLNVR